MMMMMMMMIIIIIIIQETSKPLTYRLSKKLRSSELEVLTGNLL